MKMKTGKIKAYFTQQRDIQLAYRFGSSLTAEKHEESDLDIAILFNKKPHYNRVLEISDTLSTIFNEQVDLAVLNEASPIFAMQVISRGVNIFCRDAKIKSYFVIRTVNEYDDLQYFRNSQTKNILRGRIFA